jgi:capsid protein
MKRQNQKSIGSGPMGVLRKRMREALEDLYGNFVDPREWFDDDGEPWVAIGNVDGWTSANPAPFTNESELSAIRAQCRALAASNEFAINGHENRISYIVGNGHTYRASLKKDIGGTDLKSVLRDPERTDSKSVLQDLPARVQAVIDEFLRVNNWRWRQEEIVRRRDRDGECFLRFFTGADGVVRVRFVEPGQVATPPELVGDAGATFGILTDHDDVETVVAYFIDGRPVHADEIQHRKANVDANVKRGLPLFYPVRKNLRRAEKLLRNMSTLAEVQSAITLIRKHQGVTAGALGEFVADQADATITNPTTGKTSYVKQFKPGMIVDANAGVEYEFPAAGIQAHNFVAILKAELRAIASRLVMPEFMLTSDASNAAYASTLVSEGPAVRIFSRLQAQQIDDDRQVMRRVVQAAIDAGRLPAGTLDLVELEIAAPSLNVRDPLREVYAMRVESQRGVLSPQTWSRMRGYDYDQEQTNMRQHRRVRRERAATAGSLDSRASTSRESD